ncbi:MAG TPA: DUF72 domain-containing protein [Tepidisphaeraceae bacterium]|jgi:uncharacterized protein YecE (DUF72 family)
MTRWRLGTMGFGYPQWGGVFYPPGLKSAEYLGYYARHFDTVELDTTFHATPPVGRVRRWAEATPADFRFCAKAPRAVTHDQPIDRGVGAMTEFLKVMESMGQKLAVVLLQFPPHFTVRELSRLDQFLSQMPGDVDLAAEFRHVSWQGDEVARMLAKHRVAWVWADYLDEKKPATPTADFLYLRWIGVHKRFPEINYEQVDVTDRLEWWKAQVERALAARTIHTVWGFFNNDFAGYSVATCNRMKRILGMETPEVKPLRGLFG